MTTPLPYSNVSSAEKGNTKKLSPHLIKSTFYKNIKLYNFSSEKLYFINFAISSVIPVVKDKRYLLDSELNLVK